ncbi:DUF1963 domain-containing protein [Solirubrobacter ginsenosidimutans]|uniref:DUF1963 domain-containing protein n=1 Tax=Solirubrobacter ginsenosidimutans TaxID=490573 RepID=UPI003556AC21
MRAAVVVQSIACKAVQVAPDELWPHNHSGIPMTFLAQVNCDELPEWAEEWTASALRPPAGLLLRAFANQRACLRVARSAGTADGLPHRAGEPSRPEP